jgi:hypothetical protein
MENLSLFVFLQYISALCLFRYKGETLCFSNNLNPMLQKSGKPSSEQEQEIERLNIQSKTWEPDAQFLLDKIGVHHVILNAIEAF